MALPGCSGHHFQIQGDTLPRRRPRAKPRPCTGRHDSSDNYGVQPRSPRSPGGKCRTFRRALVQPYTAARAASVAHGQRNTGPSLPISKSPLPSPPPQDKCFRFGMLPAMVPEGPLVIRPRTLWPPGMALHTFGSVSSINWITGAPSPGATCQSLHDSNGCDLQGMQASLCVPLLTRARTNEGSTPPCRLAPVTESAANLPGPGPSEPRRVC